MYAGLEYTDSRGEVGGNGSLNGESSSGSDRDEKSNMNEEGKRKGVLRKMRLHK